MNAILKWLSIFLIAYAISPFTSATAQDLTPDEKKHWAQYLEARDSGDAVFVKRKLRRNKVVFISIFEKYLLQICSQSDIIDLEMTRGLADDFNDVFNDKSYRLRFDFISKLDMFQRHKRLKIWNLFYHGYQQMSKGLKLKDTHLIKTALKQLKSTLVRIEEVKDLDLTAKIAMRCAMGHAALDDHYEACVYYRKSLDAMEGLPYQPLNHRFVDCEYREYIRKGYDPTKPKDEGGVPGEKGETESEGEEYPGRPEFENNPDLIVTELSYKPMKSPDQFVTSDFCTGANPYLWLETGFDGNKKKSKLLQFYKGYSLSFYGTPVIISRERSKFFLHLSRREEVKQEIEATAKIGKIVLVDPEDKKSKYQYFLQIPGPEESMFNLILDNVTRQRNTIELRMRTGCYTQGRLLKNKCVIIDDNNNGIFGDSTYRIDDGITSGELYYWRPDAIVIGSEKKARPWSLLQRIDEQFYLMEVDRFGKQMKTAPVTLETGTIRVTWEGETKPLYIILHLLSDKYPDAYFDVADYKNPVVLPAGQYEIATGKIEKSKRGKVSQIRMYNGGSDKIVVLAGEETVLELGEPFRFTFETTSVGKTFTVVGDSINVWGKSGELYSCFYDQVPQPLVNIRTREKMTTIAKNKKMKLPTKDDYYRKRQSVWHPLDFHFNKKRGIELEAMLKVRKIPNLGGPVTSDWR